MASKLGIVAGAGGLPGHLVEACRRSGRDFHVFAFEGSADAEALASAPTERIRFGALGKAIDAARRLGIVEVVLAGRIPRPPLRQLLLDPVAARFLARVGTRVLGDDHLLAAVIGELEEREGFRLVGADEILVELLAVPGNHGTSGPDEDSMADIERGFRVARALGALDVGQAVIVQNGTVLGLEAMEGTDALIERCAAFVEPGAPGGVLVKCSKPGQERRADLPAIGVSTVEAAVSAGLRGIALEAGGALIIERDAVVAAADKGGIFVFGTEAPEVDGDR